MSWSVVFSSSQVHIVEIVKSILSDHNINFVTVDKRDSIYKTTANPGIEVYIQSEDFIVTKNLLSDFETE